MEFVLFWKCIERPCYSCFACNKLEWLASRWTYILLTDVVFFFFLHHETTSLVAAPSALYSQPTKGSRYFSKVTPSKRKSLWHITAPQNATENVSPAMLPILTLNVQAKVLSAQMLNWNGKENKRRKGYIFGNKDKSCNKIDPHVKIKKNLFLSDYTFESCDPLVCVIYSNKLGFPSISSIVGTCYCLSCSAVLKSKREDQCALWKLEKCASRGEHPDSIPCWVNWRHKLSPEKHSAGCSWC